jgi:anti-anti-sigma factor
MVETFEINLHPGSDPTLSVISISGPLVLEHLFKFQGAWKEASAERGIIFDLAGVPYMDSSAIGSLVNAHVHFANKGKKMALAGVSPRLKEFLRVTRVDSLFQFYPDVAQAEAAVVQRAIGA